MDGTDQWFQDSGNALNASAASVRDAHRLLGAYPMASAMPSTHVTNHIGGLSTTVAPPSFMQPAYYVNTPYTSTPPSTYTEYAEELGHLANANASLNDSGYWENARDTSVRLINEQAGPSYPYPTQAHWTPPGVEQTNYPTSSFSQSIFQRTAPTSAYPTPPPPPPTMSMSSSSLAYALGKPPTPATNASQKLYTPDQSAAFVNDFIARKTEEMRVREAPARPVTPPRQRKLSPSESPDPLALRPTTPSKPSGLITPQKRKPVVEIMFSPLKRFQSSEYMRSSSTKSDVCRASPVATTPSNSRSSVPVTPSTASTNRTVKRVPYIAVPPNPWLTPSTTSKRKREEGDSPYELGGFGSEDDSLLYSPSKSATRGSRDDRAPVDKLAAQLSDIFEAEDIIPADVDIGDLDTHFFSLASIEVCRPQLHPNIIKKLSKNIGYVCRPGKRSRGTTGSPKKARIGEVDTPSLSRILKLLERSVRAGEDVDPFNWTHTSAPRKSLSPKKPRARKRSKSKTPGDDGDDAQNEDDHVSSDRHEPSALDLQKVELQLERARDSMLAAECCITVLGSDRLPKQLYSEELITSCLNTVKNQLNQIIYPFVEATLDSANPLLQHAMKDDECHKIMQEVFQTVSSAMPKLNNLVYAESVSMSDSIIISAVYIAIGPFFVIDSGGEENKSKKDRAQENGVIRTFGKTAMRGLRLDALTLIRSIFATHEEQRSWIIEEILLSLIKLSDSKQKAGVFRLRDGKSIRTVSALLLQLVQTSAHDVRVAARRIEKARVQKFALKRQESLNESQTLDEPFMDEHDNDEVSLYLSSLDSATKTAKAIILFLTRRSGTGKATKNTNEAEYRTIFDNLITDVLAVLYWPEWPAASLILSVVSRFLVSALDDVKDTKEADNNALKTMALDHLGVIAARIRTSQLKVQSGAQKSKLLKPLDDVVKAVNQRSLERLVAIHHDVLSHLSKRAAEDQANDSAQELAAATFGNELALGIKHVSTTMANDEGGATAEALENFGTQLKSALRSIGKESSSDVFDSGSQEEATKFDRYAMEIGTIQNLRHSFHPVLNVILTSLEASQIFMRTKALKALGLILMSDPTILSQSSVRRAIESHLLDSSPAVRDAAVELIGKYIIDSPEVAGIYYPKIAERIADTGLAVRKRVIKLLKEFYGITQDLAQQADITTRLVLRMLDEDEAVKDLAIKTLEQLWFPASSPPSAMKKASTAPHDDKAALLTKVTIIMTVSGSFKDRQSPLEDVLHTIISQKENDDLAYLHLRYSEICEILIDGLVDASDLPGFTVINCIRTIYLFASAYPAVLSGSNASTLLPYLKNPLNVEEQVQTDYLLKIFRVTIPHMPRTNTKFGQELQTLLQPMIIKPSSGGVQVLQESIATMCVVVQNLTKDYTSVVYLLKSCNARLQQSLKRPTPQSLNQNDVRGLIMLVFIVALLGEHFPFDSLRQENAAIAADLKSISQGTIMEHIYDSLLALYEKYQDVTLRNRLLQCLGFLFRAQPTLMTFEPSARIMDDIFSSSDPDTQGRLLKILQDFLISEALKYTAKEKANSKKTAKPGKLNMDEFIGNTEGFAESGVSSAVVQRYLEHILKACLSDQPQIQGAAVDILSFTIRQGLAHPLQSFPVVIALETSPSVSLSNRANSLHTVLHSKHTSLINTRYLHSAKAAFEYQVSLSSGEAVRGLRFTSVPPVALLQLWYSLVREKRSARQEYLKALLKVFQETAEKFATDTSQTDVNFARFMADNFSALDYKTQEEVFTVIKTLTSYLSTTGTLVLEAVSPSHLLTYIQNMPTVKTMDVDQPQPPAKPLADQLPLARSTIIVSMVMMLKSYLKDLYSLSEDKCSKFSLLKRSAIGDKAATRRHHNAIMWDRLAFATRPLRTTADVDEQNAKFLEIWNEDGLTAEPEDPFELQ